MAFEGQAKFCRHSSTAMKVAHSKTVVSRKPAGRVLKKPQYKGVQKKGVRKKDLVKKKPVCSFRRQGRGLSGAKKETVACMKVAARQIRGFYETVAIKHEDGDCVEPRIPCMLVEVADEADGHCRPVMIVGELWCDATVLNGRGRVEATRRGDFLTISSYDNFAAQTAMGQVYGGFHSARFTPTCSGSSFLSVEVDPRVDPACPPDTGHESEQATGMRGSALMLTRGRFAPCPLSVCSSCPQETSTHFGDRPGSVCASRPQEICTHDGDVICRFTIKSIDGSQKKLDVFTHLMRPVSASTVAMLQTQGVTWNSLLTETPADALHRLVACLIRR